MSHNKVYDAAIFAQARLEEPLPLARLADEVGLSQHHFHRLFTKTTGETPADYVQRLRLEKAAYRLLLHDDPVITVALDCGYTNPETLTRAFKRQFGLTPRAYRREQRLVVAGRRATLDSGNAELRYQLSQTRVVRLSALPIAYIQSTGPYEDVDPALWTELDHWANQVGISDERMLIGIGHDAPMITAPDQLRFDACITIPSGVSGNGQIRIGALPSLVCAVTTHIGSYQTLPAAYPEMFNKAASLQGYELIGLPAIEIYRDSNVDSLRAISSTDIYLPIHRKSTR